MKQVRPYAAVLAVILSTAACITIPASGPTERPIDGPSRPADTEMPLPDPTLPEPLVTVGTEEEYDVRHTLVVVNDGEATATQVVLWVAMVRDAYPYQEVLSTGVTPAAYETITDEFDNLYAKFTFEDLAAGAQQVAQLDYRVRVNELSFDLGDCAGDLPDAFVMPESNVESDAESVVSLAQTLGAGEATVCGQVRAFYDYVGDEMTYDGYSPDESGGLQALETKLGDCTEFADAMLTLTRAAGVPARFVEGVTCCTDEGYIEGETKHDWLEVFLPGTGWAPMDPTWGRFPSDRDAYFAGMSPDHVVITQGRNLAVLDDYHYYYFQYWWGAEHTSISVRETWSVLEAE